MVTSLLSLHLPSGLFPSALHTKTSTYFYSLPYVPHPQPISSFLNPRPKQYLLRNTKYEVPRTVTICRVLLLHAQTSSSPPYARQAMTYNFIAYFNLDCVTFEACSKKRISQSCTAHLMSRSQPTRASSKTTKYPQNVFTDFVLFPEPH